MISDENRARAAAHLERARATAAEAWEGRGKILRRIATIYAAHLAAAHHARRPLDPELAAAEREAAELRGIVIDLERLAAEAERAVRAAEILARLGGGGGGA